MLAPCAGWRDRVVPAGPHPGRAARPECCRKGPGEETHLLAAGDAASASVANKVNQQGEVTGTRTPSSQNGLAHAFLWHDGTLQEWTLGSYVMTSAAINKPGQVVGEGRLSDGEAHGYVWDAGRLTDLGKPVTSAVAVNDGGLVVGSNYFIGSCIHGALWTPSGPAAP